MSERLTLDNGVCAMASTDFCESQEDCYQCEYAKKMRIKLAEYENADAEGRVVVLPCKVGETLYVPCFKENGFTHDHVYEQKVDEVIVSVCDARGNGLDVFSEGDYVECYTNRAEAERALSEASAADAGKGE